jgi:hypothetical protein
MGTLGTTAAATDITFEAAAAIAAAAVSAASSSDSSPDVNVSQYLVDGDLLGPKRQEHSDQGASSASQAEVEPRKSAFKQCGEPCDKVGCRLMRFKHQKRLVCTTCMPATSFKSCSQLLCKNVIHADCLLDDAIPTWTCRSCTSATVQSTHADESDDAAASIPGVNGTSASGSTTKPTSADAVKSEAKLQVDEEDVCHDAVVFDSLSDAKQELRLRGFKVKETTDKFVRYVCTSCDAPNFRLRLAPAQSGGWACRPSVHCSGCPQKLQEKDGVKVIRYQHEFALVEGLKEYIECLGATGEMRADQLFRSVKAKFHVHVESQLLYRTARAAHDDMFGENVSDVNELMQLGERIKAEGGTFRLVLGSSCCTRFPHVMFFIWNMLSVYTVSSCHVVFGICFQCTRFAIFNVVFGTCFQCTRFAIFNVVFGTCLQCTRFPHVMLCFECFVYISTMMQVRMLGKQATMKLIDTRQWYGSLHLPTYW